MGGRDYYPRSDVREYDQSRPIRGLIAFTDGTGVPIALARNVQGVERVIDHVEVDGWRYERRETVGGEEEQVSFGEGDLHERVRQLESRNKALKAENGRIRERVSAILGEMRDELLESCDYVGASCQRKGDVLKAFGKREAELRELGIEVDAFGAMGGTNISERWSVPGCELFEGKEVRDD